MSVWRVERTGCVCGKYGYWTRHDARKVLKEMRRTGTAHPGDPLSTYRCDEGPGFWHIGHSRRSQRGANLNDPRLLFRRWL